MDKRSGARVAFSFNIRTKKAKEAVKVATICFLGFQKQAKRYQVILPGKGQTFHLRSESIVSFAHNDQICLNPALQQRALPSLLQN